VIKKILAILFAALFLVLSVPISTAADIPSLTWERGKEQNVVLGGSGVPDTWTIQLLSEKTAPLTFKRSASNASGYVVYSVQLPADFPVGYYTVEVFGEETDGGSIVAGVSVIEMAVYSITQIPSDFKSILLWLAFVISAFSVARSKKYSKFEYLREKNLIETASLVSDIRFPSVLYKIYRLRVAGFDELKPRFFSYLLKRDGNFTHKISPVLWTLIPGIGVLVGFISGFICGEGPSNIPIYLVSAIAIIGLLDAYSGIFAFFSFAAAQIMIGNITSVRSILVLICLGIAWSLSSLFAEFFLLASRCEASLNSEGLKNLRKNTALIVPSALVSGGFFFFVQRLADSLTTEIRTNTLQLVLLSIVVSILYATKEFISEKIDIKISAASGREFATERFSVNTLVSPFFVALTGLFFTLVIYVWTESFSKAIVPGIILTIPFATLLVRLSSPNISILRKWRRNIYLEAIILTTMSFGIHWLVSKTPNEVIHKSDLMLALGFLPLLFHSLLSSLYDATDSQEVERV